MLAKLFAPQNRKKFALFNMLAMPVSMWLFRTNKILGWIYLGMMLALFLTFAIYNVVQSNGILDRKDKLLIFIFVLVAALAIWYFSA